METETVLTGKKRTQFKKGNPGGPGRKKLTQEERLAIRASKQGVLKYIESQALGAAGRIVKLSKVAKNEFVQLNANKDVLDRIGIGVQKNNIGVAIQVNINEDKDEFS